TLFDIADALALAVSSRPVAGCGAPDWARSAHDPRYASQLALYLDASIASRPSEALRQDRERLKIQQGELVREPVRFSLDARLGPLAAVRGRAARAAGRAPASAGGAYGAAADIWFAAFSSHPVVAAYSALDRAPEVATGIVLQLSGPPSFDAGGFKDADLREA